MEKLNKGEIEILLKMVEVHIEMCKLEDKSKVAVKNLDSFLKSMAKKLKSYL